MNTPAIATTTAGHGVLPPDRRGRLRNGARPGDFLAAPRCGARTRCGGACCQPAMSNGRCRLHGGLSTGPRTPEGRARCAAARTTHGGYNAATRALQAEARHYIRQLRHLRLHLTAGHGVLSSRQANRKDAKSQRQSLSRVAPQEPNSFASSRLCGESFGPRPVATAGRGVLPQKPSFMQRTLLGCTALGVSVRHPVAAGHGVLPPVVLAARP